MLYNTLHYATCSTIQCTVHYATCSAIQVDDVKLGDVKGVEGLKLCERAVMLKVRSILDCDTQYVAYLPYYVSHVWLQCHL